MKTLVASLILVGLSASLHFAAADDQIPIKNFGIVTDHKVFRGAAPDDDGTDYLAHTLHITTDIDLESFRLFTILDEKRDGDPDDIHFKSEPLSSWPWIFGYIQPPITEHRIGEILDIMADPAQQPVFVHCQKGMDRTGMVVGLYRVLKQNWSPQDAWNEMLKFGYHPHFRALTKYFEKHTGWKPGQTPETDQPESETDSEIR